MLKIVWLAIFACLLGLSARHALEFSDESASYEDKAPPPPLPPAQFDGYQDDGESAELPSDLSYRHDTIANFNPAKVDRNFKQMWEQVPLTRKVDTIKK